MSCLGFVQKLLFTNSQAESGIVKGHLPVGALNKRYEYVLRNIRIYIFIVPQNLNEISNYRQ